MTQSYKQYRANIRFHIGDLDRYVEKGEILHFCENTSTLNLTGLDKPISFGKFHAVLKNKWCSPIEQPNTYKPTISQANVTPANSGNPEKKVKAQVLYETSEDERTISRVSDTKKARLEGNSNKNWEDSAKAKFANTNKEGNFALDDKDRPRRIMPIVQEDDLNEVVVATTRTTDNASMRNVSSDDGVPVVSRPLKTAAKQEKIILDGKSQSMKEPEVSAVFIPQPVKVETLVEEEMPLVSEEDSNVDFQESEVNQEDVAIVKKAMTKKNPIVEEEFHWDTTKHHKTRVKSAIEKFGSDVSALKKILAVEKQGVANSIKAKLEPSVLEALLAE